MIIDILSGPIKEAYKKISFSLDLFLRGGGKSECKLVEVWIFFMKGVRNFSA